MRIKVAGPMAGVFLLLCPWTLAYTVRPIVVPANGGARTAVNIGWERDSAGTGTVHYGPTTNYASTVVEGSSRAHHTVTLTGLTMGQLYHYKCTDTTGYDSGDNTFRAGYPDGSVTFRMAVAGDNRNNQANHQAVVNQLAGWHPELYLHNADMVANGDDWSGWQTWFADESPLLDEVVICPQRGNHESGPCYDHFLGSDGPLPSTPGSGQYYSYNFGNVHVVALSSEMDINVQKTWLQSDLAAAAADPDIQWIICNWHAPAWTTSSHGSRTDIRSTWGPILDQYKVAFVFAGHNHCYERSYPMWSDGTQVSNGTIYCTIGCGGAPRYGVGSASWLAKASSDFDGGVILDVIGNSIRFRCVQSSGTVFEDLTITRGPVEPPRCSFSPPVPGFGESVMVTYGAHLGPISNASPVSIHMGADNWTDLVDVPMTPQGDGSWKYTYAVPLNASNRVACAFHDQNDPANWDNNSNNDWQTPVDRVGTSPFPPILGKACTIRYEDQGGPLAGKATINIHLGYNGWSTIVSNNAAMTYNSTLGRWEGVVQIPDNAGQLDFVFNDGGSAWDNNNAADWHRIVQQSPPAVVFSPAAPSDCDALVTTYDPAGRGLSNASPVYLTASFDAWASQIHCAMAQGLDGKWRFTNALPPGAKSAGINFRNQASDTPTLLDDNAGANWSVTISACVGLVITNPLTNQAMASSVSNWPVAGYCNTQAFSGFLQWTNSLTAGSGVLPITAYWSILGGIDLGVGTNVITVTATNVGSSVVAADSATNSAYNGGWNNGSNGGSGWGGWTLTNWNGPNAGFFIATTNDANMNIGAKAWGLWANSSNTAEAIRQLPHALAIGEVLSFEFDNNWIQNNFSVGIGLQNAALMNLFEFMFIGGATNYVINDHAMGRDTLIPWSGDGWTLTFKLTSANAYEFTVGSNVITGTLTNVADLGITRFKAWNYSAGGGYEYNFYLNDLGISGLGSGAASNAQVSIIRQAETLFIDTDLDGMDDNWETAHSLVVGVDDSGLNPDNDLLLNWQEFVGDTPPGVSNACLATGLAGEGTVFRLQAGPPTTNSRRYELMWNSNLLQDAWTPVGPAVSGHADGSLIEWTLTNTTDAIMYYRSGVKLP
jgi:hypothetical protein